MSDARYDNRPADDALRTSKRLRTAALWSAAQLGAALQNVRGNRCPEGFGILMYHRVAEPVAGVAPPTINVSPDRLRQQLAGLLARGFEPWPLSKLIESQNKGRTISSNVFAVTFDDGFENNYANAFPILRELQVPATIFLATSYLDSEGPFPFDNWCASGSNEALASAWRPLTTAQCREMLASGLIELGAHTHTHGRFIGRGDEFRRDLSLCLDVLRERFGVTAPAFAFPFGDFTPELIQVAQQLGVACCLTTGHRRVHRGDSVFCMGRFHVEPYDTPSTIAAKLTGWRTSVMAAGKLLAFPLVALWTATRYTAAGRAPLLKHFDTPCGGRAGQG